ncbi:hypothetical protein CYMTET_23173 [Cymbomonas tetramitiformis]|uniref:Uncharacterized protein n=1 Tax=Cymbomonas tetramitiformis TaxID=36881 RepID=A0AAE0FYT5_9CHLO|nr:hypothetical protein CYMTET_23173 [Cymbomonas tetramitiformis]
MSKLTTCNVATTIREYFLILAIPLPLLLTASENTKKTVDRYIFHSVKRRLGNLWTVIVLMARMTTTVVLMFLLGTLPFGTSTRLDNSPEFHKCLLTPPSCNQLDLSSNSITGPLPTELGLLTSLDEL